MKGFAVLSHSTTAIDRSPRRDAVARRTFIRSRDVDDDDVVYAPARDDGRARGATGTMTRDRVSSRGMRATKGRCAGLRARVIVDMPLRADLMD